MVRSLESVLAASLSVCLSVFPSVKSPHVASETSRDWNGVVAGDLGVRNWLNVRYHPTLNLSFAMLSPVSSAAADP